MSSMLERARLATVKADKSGTMGYIVTSVKVVKGEDSYTDGKKIVIAERHLRDLKTATFVLTHEALHILFQHPWRGKELVEKYGQELVNIAADIIVDYAAEKILGYTAHKEIYIPYSTKVVVNGVEIELPKPIEDFTLEELTEYLSRFAQVVEVYTGVDKHDNWEEATELDRELMRGMLTEALKKFRGIMPGEEEMLVKAEKPIAIPARLRVKQWLEERLGYQYLNWKRPSRRSEAVGAYLPRWRGKGGLVGVALDTSGSMFKKGLTEALNVIQGTLMRLGIRTVIFVQGDTEVKEVRKTSVGRLKELVARGGGGTVLRPLVEELEKRHVGAIIVITDGYVNPEDFEEVKTPTLIISLEEDIVVENPKVEVVVWDSKS